QATFLVIVEFVQPSKFFEYFLALLRGNAAPRVPHFDVQNVASAPATQEHPSTACVAYRVGKEVLQYPPQQLRIGENYVVAIGGAQTQPPIAGHHRKLRSQAPDNLRKREMFEVSLLGARMQARNIEQSTQQILAGDVGGLGLGDECSV